MKCPPCPRCVVPALFAAGALAQAPRTAEPCVITPVRTSLAADAPAYSIVVEHGRIARIVPASDPLPAATRVIDGRGQLALPAFVDAASHAACSMPEPEIDQDLPADMQADVQVDMRAANRKGIAPAFRAAATLDFTADERKAWRESGFGAVLAAPRGQILAGTSALVVTREAAARDSVLLADVFAHAAFAASGPGYPSTLMGYTAQLRQLVLDARHQDELAARALAGRPGPRPAFDPELEALGPVLRRERRVACQAQLAKDVDRWLALGDELGFEVVIVGGNQAFERADELARRGVPVILTLEWGDEPEDPEAAKPDGARTAGEGEAAAGEVEPAEPPAQQADDKRFEYQAPRAVRQALRTRWEERRDCAKALAAKGVRFAFASAGGSASDLLGKVRKMVEAGLPRDVALHALTAGAAEILGAPRLGKLEVGQDADVALWTADPLSKDARLAWLVVDGFAHEFDLSEAPSLEGPPDQGVDASGEWTLAIAATDQPTPPQTLTLVMKPDGEVSGTIAATNPIDQQPLTARVTGRVAKRTMRLDATFDVGTFQVKARYEGELDGDAWKGTLSIEGGFGQQKLDFQGTRKPR